MRLLASALRRKHWRASLLLVLLIGVAGGVVLTAIAGARRTERALPEFVAYNDLPSLLVALCPPDATPETVAEDPLACFFYEPDGELDELARLPGVRAVGRGAAVLASATRPGRPDEWARVLLFAQQARSTARSFGRPLVIEGRTLDPEAPDELEIDEQTARALSLDVGDQLVVSPYLAGEMDVAGEGSVPASGPATSLTVVGIVRHPQDVASPVRNEVGFTEGDDSELYVGPGWWEANGPAVATYGSMVAVHTDDPRTVEQTIRDHWPGRPVLFETDDELASDDAEQAIRLGARALWIVAAVALLAAIVFVSQTVGRQMRRELQAAGAMRALGMTRRELTLAVALRMATVAVGAGLLAAGTAVLMSPLAPVGIARRAALDLGLAVDAPVLMAGAALVVVAVLAMALPVAARSSAEERATTRPRMVGPRARRLSAEGLAGLRLTGPGGGRSVGTAVLGVAVAAAAAISAATLVQTLGRVSTTPASWGWGFDAGVGNASDLEQEAVNLEKVLSLPVEAAAAQLEGTFEVVSPTRRIETTLVALERVEQLPGALTPVMTDGRPPGPGEIALGAITRRQLDVDLGDVVAVRDPSLGEDAAPATELVVVGEARVVDISGSQPGHGGYVDAALIRGGLEYSAQMFCAALRPDGGPRRRPGRDGSGLPQDRRAGHAAAGGGQPRPAALDPLGHRRHRRHPCSGGAGARAVHRGPRGPAGPGRLSRARVHQPSDRHGGHLVRDLPRGAGRGDRRSSGRGRWALAVAAGRPRRRDGVPARRAHRPARRGRRRRLGRRQRGRTPPGPPGRSPPAGAGPPVRVTR